MIAEVVVEALPQWIMQAVIFVMVSEHVRDGTASAVDITLYEYQDGSFVSLMPKSILISTLTMLKTWYDIVQEVCERTGARRHAYFGTLRLFWLKTPIAAHSACG